MPALSPDKKVQRYFCNRCSHKTRHFVQSEFESIEHDDQFGVSLTRHLLIVECCGCEHLSFVRRSHFSEHIDYRENPITGDMEFNEIWDEETYPPPTFRSPPDWFEDLPDPTMRNISAEIYKALQTESLYLATFGSRTLIDRLIVLTVGDKGNFGAGLRAILAEGKISQHEHDILNPVIQAGHAAAHRGWAPSLAQIKTILDTVEGLIHRLLVLPQLAEELDEAVPNRGSKSTAKAGKPSTMKEKVDSAPHGLRSLFDALSAKLKQMGADVSVHPQKHYYAFKRNRNFASVQIYNQRKVIKAYLNIDPDEVDCTQSGVRDVRQVGHYGTGDLEITISEISDLDHFDELFSRSYAES